MTPRRLYMIRHGETDWNAAKRLQGSSDIALNEAGRADAKAWQVPDYLFGPQVRWCCSPLQRAMETARILARERAVIAVDSNLREMSFGDWEGRTLEEVRAEGGHAVQENEARGLDFTPEGGESPRDVQIRLRHFLDAWQGAGDIVAIAHKGVIRAMISLATGWDMTGKPPMKVSGPFMYVFTVNDAGEIGLSEKLAMLENAATDAVRERPHG